MSVWWTAALAAALLPGPSLGGDPPGKEPAERLKALRQEVDDAEAAYRKAASSYKEGDPEGPIDKLWEAYLKKSNENLPKVLELARQDPKSEAAFEALAWVANSPRNAQMPTGAEAAGLLGKYHAENPKVGPVCGMLGYYGNSQQASTLEFLRAVREKNPDRTARGQATLALARLTNNQGRYLQYRKEGDPQPLFQEAERLFAEATEKYADCPDLRQAGIRKARTLGEEAAVELFELRHLAIGKVAPEIVGEDLDGKEFKLSDYRGKVVVLDFWGNW
jgi:hypothetical protein